MAEGNKYRMNPQVGRMHESGARPDIAVKKPDAGVQEGGEEHGGFVELHGKDPGPFKTVHVAEDGTRGDEREHATLHDAHHAMNEHTGSDGCSGSGDCEHGTTSNEFNDAGEASGSTGADDEY